MNASTLLRSSLVVMTIACLASCQGGSKTQSSGKKEGQAIAVVNGSTITTGDFSKEVKNLPEYLRSMADTADGRKEMLETLVIRELILQQASKDAIDMSPEVAEKLEDLKKRVIVEAYLKKKVETESLVSDDDMKKFYEKNKDRFKTGDQIKASHILVKAEKDAKEALEKIKSGSSFEEVAKKSSVDSSASKGGDLGWFGKGTMVPAFEKAAFALKEGQVSEVIKSDFGYHIIKLTGKRAAGARPFDEVKDQIKAAILPTKQQEVFQKIKENLKKEAKITINEDVLKGIGSEAKDKDAPGKDQKKPEQKTEKAPADPKQPAQPEQKK